MKKKKFKPRIFKQEVKAFPGRRVQMPGLPKGIARALKKRATFKLGEL